MKRILMPFLIAVVLGLGGISCQDTSRTDTSSDTFQTDISSDTQVVDSVVKEERIAIPIDRVGGVYAIPATVNGLKMNFIFDTGASEVSLSLTEAVFMLKNGYLEEEDFRGSAKTQMANGEIEENTRVVLKEVEVEGVKIKNIPALVVNNIQAPLLLGQSAIKELGEVLIKEDSIFIIRKVEKPESKTKTASAKLKKKERSWRETLNKMGFHSCQDDIDSLLLSAKKACDDKDYVQANYYLNECVSLCEKHRLWIRNWEIYYIKGLVARESSNDIEERWKQFIPYLKLAFDCWDKQSEGFAVEAETMLNKYAMGIADHYGIPIVTMKADRLFEEESDRYNVEYLADIDGEFSQVINYLSKYDPYKAYCHCGIYYKDNITVAESYLQKALAINKKAPTVYQYFGRIYMDTNKPKAIDYLNQALVYCNSKYDLGYSYRLLAICQDWYGDKLKYMRLAAQNGDNVAIDWMKSQKKSW